MTTGSIGLMAALVAATSSTESFIQAPGPLGPLKATMLSSSSQPAPMVLIVPGSGPMDRDGNSPAGVKASSYRLLAEQLAARGISSVRIDKRGMYASAAAVADANAVTISDYASDIKSWIATIRASTGVRCVWVLGHSEGGLVALAAGQKPGGICGLVLVAAPGRPLGAILREQLHANPANGPLLAQADKAIDELEAGQRVEISAFSPLLTQLFRPSVQGFLIDAFSYDPAKLVVSVRMPVLILQGERDLQVSVGDARRLAQAQPAAHLVLLPDVNHVLKTVTTDDRRANVATYADPGLPLAAGIADTVATFVGNGGNAAKK